MHLLMLSSLSETVTSALEINLTQMLIQIAATIVLVVIVRVFFWSKITSFLEKRREFIASELESAKAQNTEALSLKENAIKERQDILLRSKEIIDAAKTQAEAEKASILMDAKKDALRLVEAKREEMEMEMERARSDLRSEVVDLAVQMAEKVIASEIDQEKYKDMSIAQFERSEN